MYCKNCGSIIDQGAQFCRACGARVDPEEPMQEPAQKAEPVSVQNAQVAPRTVYIQAPPTPAPPQSNEMAIIGFAMAFVMPLIGLIFSIIGLKKSKSGAPNRGFALAGVIISAIYCASGLLAVLAYFLWFYIVLLLMGGAASSGYNIILAAGCLLI